MSSPVSFLSRQPGGQKSRFFLLLLCPAPEEVLLTAMQRSVALRSHPGTSPSGTSRSLLSPRFPLCPKSLTHPSRGQRPGPSCSAPVQSPACAIPGSPTFLFSSTAAGIGRFSSCSDRPPKPGSPSAQLQQNPGPRPLVQGVNSPLVRTCAAPRGKKSAVVSLMGLDMTPGWLAAQHMHLCLHAGTSFHAQGDERTHSQCRLWESGLKPRMKLLVTVFCT